ncbi:hypothetical protein AAMO2058_000895900 [Amorphochlora amoebiformis]
MAAMHPRTIVHIDLDCFYAQVEMVADPKLKDKPLGIQQKNIIVTCNYPARARGVHKLMYINKVPKVCPDLIIRDGSNLKRYREASEKILDHLRGWTPEVERLGMDEFFLDVTHMVADEQEKMEKKLDFVGHVYRGETLTLIETQTRNESHVPSCTAKVHHCRCGCYQRLMTGSHIAQRIRTSLYQTLGYTASAGISVGKMIAKLSGELKKPNQQTTMLPAYIDGFLAPLRVRKIPGCGYSTSKKLASLGIETVTQLRNLSKQKLIKAVGAQIGGRLHDLAFGLDTSHVVATVREKQMSEEDSFKSCTAIDDVALRILSILRPLLERVRMRFQKHGDLPSTLRLTIRDRLSHQKTEQSKINTSGGAYFTTRTSRQTTIPLGFFHPENKKQEGYCVDHLMKLFFKMLLPASKRLVGPESWANNTE